MKRRYHILFMIVCFAVEHSYAQNQQQKEDIVSTYNETDLNNLMESLQGEENDKKDRVNAFLTSQGNSVLANSESTERPIDIIDGYPVYYSTTNDDAAGYTNTDVVHSIGYQGSGMTMHVWDGSVARLTHQEYGGRVSNGDGSAVSSNSNNFSHATHVTGTTIASGVNGSAKGMAPLANAVSYNWSNDIIEMFVAAQDGALVSNHSYGFGISQFLNGRSYELGRYNSSFARRLDDIMYNAPYYLMVCSAGNEGSNDSHTDVLASGYDKLTGFSTAKNNLVIANYNYPYGVSSSSSEGPTDDLRIKPDLTGQGTGLFSSNSTSNTSYSVKSGTSMASPNVAGSLLLLQEMYEDLKGTFMHSSTLKGLAIHTATDVHTPGPDAVTGWGFLNTQKAAALIGNEGSKSIIKELTLNPGESYVIEVKSDNINSLLGSVTWTDPAGPVISGTTANLSTKVLVNDLDLRITKGSQKYYPYRLSSAAGNSRGDNSVDPHECIDVPNASGTYFLTVTHKGSLTNGFQNFSLIVSGIKDVGFCDQKVYLTGSLSDPMYASANWIATIGPTTIPANDKVVFNANKWSGHVDLNLDFEAMPTGDGTFDIRLESECGSTSGLRVASDVPTSEVVTTDFIDLSFDKVTEISVFPNPVTSGDLHFEYPVSNYILYSEDGLEVLRGENADKLDIDNLAEGVYLLDLDGHTQKIIKSK